MQNENNKKTDNKITDKVEKKEWIKPKMDELVVQGGPAASTVESTLTRRAS